MSRSYLLRFAVPATAAALIWASSASAREEFPVSAYCPMVVSVAKGDNPGDLHTVPGRVYSVYARQPAKGKAEWVQVYTDDRSTPLRWVQTSCASGNATAASVQAQQRKERERTEKAGQESRAHAVEYKPLKSLGLCPLYISKHDKRNPGELTTVPGRRYAVYALDDANPARARWAQVYTEDTAAPLRWLEIVCAGKHPQIDAEGDDEKASAKKASATEDAKRHDSVSPDRESQRPSDRDVPADREPKFRSSSPVKIEEANLSEDEKPASSARTKDNAPADFTPLPYKVKGATKGGGVIAPSACAESKKFDSLTLAMVWHPGRCAANMKSKDCAPAYARDGWTLYGLWPESKACGDGYGYCGAVKAAPKAGFCDYPPLKLSEPVRKRLENAMPAAAAGLCLQRHEWYKYGACYRGEPDAYFTASLDFTARVASAEPFYSFLRSGGQRTVSRTSVEEALNVTFGEGASRHASLLCEEGRFTELRVMLPGDADMSAPLKELIAKAPLSTPGNCGARFWIDVPAAK